MKKYNSIKINRLLLLFISTISILSCSSDPFSIELYNQLDISRQTETVEIDLKKIPESIQSLIEKIGVYDVDKATFLTKQLIDMNHDGVMDLLLFQPNLPPMSSKTFHLKLQPVEKSIKDWKDSLHKILWDEYFQKVEWEHNKEHKKFKKLSLFFLNALRTQSRQGHIVLRPSACNPCESA